jgi:WD40 repeat protein
VKLRMRLCCLVATTLFTGVGFALPYALGDVFASTGNGRVSVFDSSGTLKQVLNNGLGSTYTTGGMFDAAGNYYVTTFGGNVVSKWDNNGNLINGSFMTGCNSDCESMTRDKSGNAFVGQADGTADIRKYDIATGAFLTSYNAAVSPRGTDWVDLAADQKTIYTTSEGGLIRRYDTSTSTQLSAFNAVDAGGSMFALRILADGGVLVAHSSDVLRYDSTGALVQTYAVGGHSGTLFALNLDPNGTSFWTGDLGGDNKVFRVDIASGTVLNSFDTNTGTNSFYALAGLSVYGEITQGGGGGPTVPEPGSIVLLGTMMAGLALTARKKFATRRE